MRTTSNRYFVFSILLVFSCALSVHGSNRISSTSIRIQEALSPEEISEIRALETWPFVDVEVDDANDGILQSLQPLSGMVSLTIDECNPHISSLDFLENFKNLIELDLDKVNGPNKDTPFDVSPISRLSHLRRLELNGITAIP